MNYIAWFKDLSKDSINEAGGKGANLGEMWNAQLPIPGGFVITAPTYKEFIEKTQIKDKILDIIKDLDVNDTAKLQQIAQQIQELIRDGSSSFVKTLQTKPEYQIKSLNYFNSMLFKRFHYFFLSFK